VFHILIGWVTLQVVEGNERGQDTNWNHWLEVRWLTSNLDEYSNQGIPVEPPLGQWWNIGSAMVAQINPDLQQYASITVLDELWVLVWAVGCCRCHFPWVVIQGVHQFTNVFYVYSLLNW
jgi:hypothetical protein